LTFRVQSAPPCPNYGGEPYVRIAKESPAAGRGPEYLEPPGVDRRPRKARFSAKLGNKVPAAAIPGHCRMQGRCNGQAGGTAARRAQDRHRMHSWRPLRHYPGPGRLFQGDRAGENRSERARTGVLARTGPVRDPGQPFLSHLFRVAPASAYAGSTQARRGSAGPAWRVRGSRSAWRCRISQKR